MSYKKDNIDFTTNYISKQGFFDIYPSLSNIVTSPALWVWGDNYSDNLGTNDRTNRSSPVQTIAGGTNWKQVSTGSNHTAAIKTDGSLWMMGSNLNGQLGDNTTVYRSSPVQTIAGGTNWKQVSCAGDVSAAIKTDGTLWCWGWNSSGELGTNDRTKRSSPIQTIAGGTNWKQVSCGTGHSAAIKTDGTLWNWGFAGLLGDNTNISKSSPVQTIAGGTNWKQVSVGVSHTAAIKTDGTLWLWGECSDGQLGTNDVINRSSPVQTVAGGTNWKQVACGSGHSIAIKTDGTLWCWGGDSYGQLGDNTTISKSSPVQTIAGGNNWKQITGGGNHTAAIKTDGTLWLWGDNYSGSLGDNTTIPKSSPVQTVAGGTNWKQVSCNYSTLAIAEDNIYL